MRTSGGARAAKPRRPCALCLQPKPLCQSHIIPEFCYRPSYDAKHRGLESSSRAPKSRFLQKGKRERLLCADCDNVVVGRYEKHFKESWFDKPALPHVISGPLVSVRGIDYALFKLFHLSVLWRAGESSLPEFSNVSLGPHADKLRQMLWTGDAGPEEAYPVIGAVIVLDSGEVVYDLITAPLRFRQGAFTRYYMCYAGCEWHFIVNRRTSADHQKLTIRKGCPLELAVRPLMKVNSVRLIARGLAASRGR